MKKTRRTVEQEYFIILRKLASADSLKRADFELPKVKGKTVSEYFDPKVSQDSYVPHSSLIQRLNELKQMEVVDEYDSGLKSKKNLPIMEYCITVLGTIKLLQLCDETKFLQDVWSNSYHLSYLLPTRKFLTQGLGKKLKFRKKQLFHTLVSVCKNIKIKIDNDPGYSKPNIDSWVSASELLQGKKGLKVYHVFLTVRHGDFSYTVWERIPAYAKENHKGEIRFVDIPAYMKINELVSCAFFHELILRCSSIEFVRHGYPQMGKYLLMEYLRRDKDLKRFYLDFIDRIERKRFPERKLIDEIKIRISQKRSLLKSEINPEIYF